MTNTLFADNEISPNLRKILSRHDGKTKHGKTLYLNKQNISFKQQVRVRNHCVIWNRLPWPPDPGYEVAQEIRFKPCTVFS